MTIRKVLGFGLLAIPFVVITAGMLATAGLAATAGIWGAALLLIATICVGLHLVNPT